MKTIAAAPFLSLRKAAFRLGERILFEHTCWTFRKNEQWAIVGANGSGKSLLVDGLCGRLPLVAGEIQFHFRPPPGLSPEDAISVVSFEQRKLELHESVVQSRWNSIEEEGALLVREFLSYERAMEVNPFEVTDRHDQARPQFQRRSARAIRLLGIEPLLDRALLTLSNGEMQKVQLARALSRPVRLLILDEPFLGLDTLARSQLHRVLEKLMKASVRVLLIVSRMEDLPKHITHLMWIDQCKIVATGTKSQVLAMPPIQRLLGRKAAPKRKAITATPIAFAKNSTSPVGRRRKLVAMRNVTVRYGDCTILQNINWTICKGESWALLGPNGSGKTTLLSLIMGDHPQGYGNDITVFGQKRGCGESIWEIKRRIGWISPELQLHFNQALSCFEVVGSGFFDSVGLFQELSPSQRSRIQRMLNSLGLGPYADEPLSALSAGLQRMVLLARALIKQPSLLILDEPCQGLDQSHRDFFVDAIDQLIRTGKETVIYVTHRPEELPRSINQFLRLAPR